MADDNRGVYFRVNERVKYTSRQNKQFDDLNGEEGTVSKIDGDRMLVHFESGFCLWAAQSSFERCEIQEVQVRRKRGRPRKIR